MSFYGIRRFGCKLLCRRVKVNACFSVVYGTFKQNISIASVIDKITKIMTFLAIEGSDVNFYAAFANGMVK